MNRKRHTYREKNPSHQELLEKGFSLYPITKGQKKGDITSIRWGSNGRRYWKVLKMSKSESKIFSDAKKRKKAGKEIMYSFEPISLMMTLSVDVKKDKRGNVTVNIKQAKKGYCNKWDCSKKAKKNYSLCVGHLKENKARLKK